MLEDGDHYLSAMKMERYSFLSDVENDARRRGLAIIKAIDTRVGRIVEQLSTKGLDTKTLVIFSSDNGAPIQLHWDKENDYRRMVQPSKIPPGGVYKGVAYVGSENLPLRGAKQSVWEGGIKVPMLAYWPGRIPPGLVVDETITTLDLTATMAHAAGINQRPGGHFHGESLLDRLLGKSDIVDRGTDGYKQHFYWIGANGDHAIRIGHWKLRLCGEAAFLFNITADPSELVNRAEASPDWVIKMSEILDHWLERLPFKPPPCSTIDHFVRKKENVCPTSNIDSRFRQRVPYTGPGKEVATCWPAQILDWNNSVMGLSKSWHWKPGDDPTAEDNSALTTPQMETGDAAAGAAPATPEASDALAATSSVANGAPLVTDPLTGASRVMDPLWAVHGAIPAAGAAASGAAATPLAPETSDAQAVASSLAPAPLPSTCTSACAPACTAACTAVLNDAEAAASRGGPAPAVDPATELQTTHTEEARPAPRRPPGWGTGSAPAHGVGAPLTVPKMTVPNV